MGKNKLNKKIVLFAMILIVVFLLYQQITYLYSDYNNNKKTLVFMGNNNIAPIIFEENGTAKGIVVDIAKELGKKIGYKIEIKATEWQEAQNKVLSGEADALLQINPSSEREKLYDFSNELLRTDFSIFKEYGNTDIYTVIDLKDKNVGVESGGYPYYLLTEYDGINIVTISDWNTGFQMIKSGELDAIVADRWIGKYELAQSKVEGIEVLEKPIETQYSRIAIKKGNEELLNLINVGLEELNDDGTMADILSDWQGKKVVYFTEESIQRTFLYAIIIILFLISLISLYGVRRFRALNKKLELDVMERTQELNNANEKLKKTNEDLERISMIDPLTNISNRRYFDSFLQKVWESSIRENLPLSLIMVDIDNFKMYNDTYGHLAGDRCLRNVADVIKNTLKRSGDMVARFGGEEFVVLLSNTTEDGAMVVAEDIRAKTENLGMKNEGLATIITISLGVASVVPDESMYPENIINAADQALYQAKKDGRNRVERVDLLMKNL